jgi:hypothetical protein
MILEEVGIGKLQEYFWGAKTKFEPGCPRFDKKEQRPRAPPGNQKSLVSGRSPVSPRAAVAAGVAGHYFVKCHPRLSCRYITNFSIRNPHAEVDLESQRSRCLSSLNSGLLST